MINKFTSLSSFRGLLKHLASLPRNQLRYPGTQTTVPILTDPTLTQRRAFDLINQPHPTDPEVRTNQHQKQNPQLN